MPNVGKFGISSPKILSIRKCYYQLLQIFLQQYYSAILSLELHCSTILKQNNICLFKYLTLSLSLHFSVSHLLSLSTTASLSLITSLSHSGLFWCGLWVQHGGGETGEVEIGMVCWRFLGFLGPDRCGMIGSVFKLFWRGFLSTSASKVSCTSHGSARLSARNEPRWEVRDWAIQWSFS